MHLPVGPMVKFSAGVPAIHDAEKVRRSAKGMEMRRLILRCAFDDAPLVIRGSFEQIDGLQ